MLKLLNDAKTKLGATISSFLSAIGISGSTANAVCQTTCSTSTSVLPILGVSLSATPLAFLVEYHVYIWWFAALFLIVLVWLYGESPAKSKTDRALLLINAGLLTIGFPYFRSTVLSGILTLSGILMLLGGAVLLVTAKKIVIAYEN